MIRYVYAFISLCFLMIVGVAAQPAPPQPATPEVQALQSRVMQEINANLACTTQAISLQAELANVRRQLEEARAKIPAEPAKPGG